MTVRCGTDIVAVRRIEEALQRYGERFVQRLLTEAERDVLGHLPDISEGMLRYAERLAARFAGKEAVAKALRTEFTVSTVSIGMTLRFFGILAVLLFCDLAARRNVVTFRLEAQAST